MTFGSSDIIETTPVQVTETSVTWRWKENRAIDITSFTASYVGYYIWYRKTTETTWSMTAGIVYQFGLEYQQGTVYGLEPETRYEFDISVYRTYQGQIYDETNYKAVSGCLGGTYLTATTGVLRFTYVDGWCAPEMTLPQSLFFLKLK